MGSERRAALVLAAILLTSAPAWAEPTAADKENARQLMRTARERRDAGDLKGALEAFQAADAIMHVPTTGYEVGATQVQMGRLVEGRDTLLRAARIPERADDPAPFAEARKKATALYEEIGPRVPTVEVVIRGVPASNAPQVTVDTVPVPREALRAPRRVNPGHHVVVAKVGRAERRAEVDVAERDAKSVALDFTGADMSDDHVASTAPDAKPKKSNYTLSFVGFGVGVVGLGVGALGTFLAIDHRDKARAGCIDNLCPPATHDDIDAAKTWANVATGGYIVGAVGVAVGVVGLFTGRAKTTKPTQAAQNVSVEPWMGIGSAGLHGRF